MPLDPKYLESCESCTGGIKRQTILINVLTDWQSAEHCIVNLDACMEHVAIPMAVTDFSKDHYAATRAASYGDLHPVVDCQFGA